MNHLRSLAPAVALVLVACNAPLTRKEAAEAVEEVKLTSQAVTLASGTIEIKTDFTIGEAVEKAADEIRTFYEDQLPCAAVTLSGSTLSVEYGVNGTCFYRGQQFSGSHSITVTKNDMSDVVVDHEWDELSNGVVEVSGNATVTWDFEDPSRHVVHELEWTRLSDGRTGTGSGDRVQKPHPDGLDVGITVDGTRTWEGESGQWDLAINDIEVRWLDPVPRSGSYTLDTPFNKSASLSFEEVDAHTIRVTLESGRKSYDFNVVSLAPADG